MRYILENVKKDLQKKLVFLAGPRQVGKSTLARTLISSEAHYLNWDISNDRKVIREKAWPKDGSIVVIDELHKLFKWKNFLKGVIDEFQNKPPLLVTGSARLDTFRKGGDALTGRTYIYRFHPIDPLEAVAFFKAPSLPTATHMLLQTGGFPEAFLYPQEAARLREDRLSAVIREDLRDISAITDLAALQLLIELLRDRVGGTLNYSNLAADVGVSAPTIKRWLTFLEHLYLIFTIRPYSRMLSRTIKREPKLYFFDCASATNGIGFRFENMVACHLLKQIHFLNDSTGTRFQLHYFRDKDQHEVDFVITSGLKPVVIVEAKLNNEDPSSSLKFLKARLGNVAAFQLVGGEIKRRDYSDLSVVGIQDLNVIFEKIVTTS